MSGARYALLTCKIVALSITLSSASGWAQQDARPELGGIWTNAALTRLTRPATVDQLIVTAAQAQQIIASTTIASLEAMPLAERCLLGFGNTAGPGILAGARRQEADE